MIKQKNHVVDLLFSLALFCVFAASALTIVIMGADVYQKSVNDMNRNSTIRTSLSYLSEKIHQNDAENGIRIDQLNNLPSLVLTQNLNGETYETWIYAYDGMLCEIMTDLENGFTPEEGQPILEIGSFSLEQNGSRIILTVSDTQGNTSSLSVSPRSSISS